MQVDSYSQARETLERNLAFIQEKVKKAQEKGGQKSVLLVVVTKRNSFRVFPLLLELGLKHFGESYFQDAFEKIKQLPEEVRQQGKWHFIGHLQRNKARKVVSYFHWIHSVDSKRLLGTLDRLGREKGRKIEVFLQVNTSGEPQKFGFSPEELEGVLEYVSDLRGVQPIGLMTMAPYVEKEKTRPYFIKLRELRDRYKPFFPSLEHLSMGMSNDFEVAVEEGATVIRIGRAFFEGVNL